MKAPESTGVCTRLPSQEEPSTKRSEHELPLTNAEEHAQSVSPKEQHVVSALSDHEACSVDQQCLAMAQPAVWEPHDAPQCRIARLPEFQVVATDRLVELQRVATVQRDHLLATRRPDVWLRLRPRPVETTQVWLLSLQTPRHVELLGHQVREKELWTRLDRFLERHEVRLLARSVESRLTASFWLMLKEAQPWREPMRPELLEL